MPEENIQNNSHNPQNLEQPAQQIPKFTHLHVHSHYSLLDGLPKIDQLLAHTKANGMTSMALTDHGNLYGAVEFYQKAKEAGVKPIIGAEVYCAFEGLEDKRPNIDNKIYHLILLAKNKIGYQNLVKLVTTAQLKGYYYKPRIDDNLLAKYSEGLIATSACIQGRIPRTVINGHPEQAAQLAEKYKTLFGEGNFYLEIQNHPSLQGQDLANNTLIDFSKKLNIPLIATHDSHYLNPDDNFAQDILMLINTGADHKDPERLTMKGEDFSMPPPAKMAAFCNSKGVPEAVTNTEQIAEQCNFQFQLGETKLPHFETPDNKDTNEYMKELCYQGLKGKAEEFTDNKQEAIDRLEYELSVIAKTGFASYFLIVADFVNWAKQKRIVVGPGRGSCAGSLVAYLLNITEVNPLKFGLLFERFLNPDRISMPDIDLDFADKRRDEVIEHVAEKYGRNHVAQIITFGTMAARAVIRDVGRALSIDYGYCDKVAKMVPFGHTLQQCVDDVAEFRQLYNVDQQCKKLIDLAMQLEGCARHASTHACGVVISKDPLDQLVPLQHPSQKDDSIVTQYEMHAIEDLGLLKMDFLGLKNLTIIEDTLKRIYMVQNQSIDIAKIPQDDKATFKLLKKAHTTSVFQLEGGGMKRYLKDLKPNSLDDIIAMVALYRPGPIELIPSYIARKHGKEPINYIHPSLEKILEPTYGLPVFQEQIMQIARTLAGFTLSEADVLRKAIGKKIKHLLDAQKDKFIKGCIANNVDKHIAEKVFSWVEPHAQYSFNKSHAAAYATIAYRTAYLKAHYPVEFMSAVLTSERNDMDRISFLLDECKNMGIKVLAPDINESFHNFSVVPKENKIRFGLLAVKNVGANIVSAIIEERNNNGAYKSFSDFASRIQHKDFNKKSLESLIKAGTFDKFKERGELLSNLESILEFNREIRKAKEGGQTGLFDSLTSASPLLQLASAPPINTDEALRWEKELLGLYISSHPLESVRNILASRALPIKEMLNGSISVRDKVIIGGIISSVKKIITKKGDPMLFVSLEDLTSKTEVIVFPSILQENPDAFIEDKMVFVTGKVSRRDEIPKLICETIEEIREV